MNLLIQVGDYRLSKFWMMRFMGFDVDRDNKVVTVDHDHNRFATTTVQGNPKTKNYSGLTVVGIFRRNKGASRVLKKQEPNSKIHGDNSPMLYALKNMDGLTTAQSDVRSLFRNARKILRNELSELDTKFDYIVTIPSSHKLTRIVAQMTLRTCRFLAHPVEHLSNVLHKASAADVKAQVLGLGIKSNQRTTILSNVKKFIKTHGEDKDFQIKYINKPYLRKHVNLLVLNPAQAISDEEISILLVDDMVTTGHSLTLARDLILQCFPNAHVRAVCLFSAP